MKLVECVYVYVAIKVYQYSKTSLIFMSGETLMVRDFTGCLPEVNIHIGKPVSYGLDKWKAKVRTSKFHPRIAFTICTCTN